MGKAFSALLSAYFRSKSGLERKSGDSCGATRGCTRCCMAMHLPMPPGRRPSCLPPALLQRMADALDATGNSAYVYSCFVSGCVRIVVCCIIMYLLAICVFTYVCISLYQYVSHVSVCTWYVSICIFQCVDCIYMYVSVEGSYRPKNLL